MMQAAWAPPESDLASMFDAAAGAATAAPKQDQRRRIRHRYDGVVRDD